MFVMVSDALVDAIGASLGGVPQAPGGGRQNKKDASFRLENLRFLGFWHRGWGGRDRGRYARRRRSGIAHPSSRSALPDTVAKKV